VNLEANTAEFSGDLAKAAGTAQEFGAAAAEAGTEADYSMREARGTVALLGEEIGVRVPRHLQTFIAELGPIGPALEAAFSAVALIALIELLVKGEEKIRKWFDSLSDLTAAEKASFDAATKGSADLLKAQENCIRAAYELAEANAAGDPIKQGEIKVEMEKELGAAHAARMTGILAELDKNQTLIDQLKEKIALQNAPSQDQASSPDFQGMSDTGGTALLQAELEKREALQEQYRQAVGAEQNAQMLGDAALISSQHALGEAQESAAQKAAAAQEHLTELVAKAHATLEKTLEDGVNEESRIIKEQLNQEMKERMKASEEAVKAAREGAQQYEAVEDEVLRHSEKTAEEQFKAAQEAGKRLLAAHKESAQQIAQDEIAASQRETSAEVAAMQARIAAFTNYTKDREKKELELQNKIAEIQAAGAAREKQIQDQADQSLLSSVVQATNRMGEAFASAAAKSIMEGKNMGQALEKVGAQAAEEMLKNFLMAETVEGREKLIHAKGAAEKSYDWASNFGGPLAGAAAAALAFAGVMAFADGGRVPGMGTGDTVPAMLSPGETVVSAALTQQVESSRNGGGHHFHFSPVISAIDGDGVEAMLAKHESKFAARMTSILRKHNRG
jgi:hypothetical protein